MAAAALYKHDFFPENLWGYHSTDALLSRSEKFPQPQSHFPGGRLVSSLDNISPATEMPSAIKTSGLVSSAGDLFSLSSAETPLPACISGKRKRSFEWAETSKDLEKKIAAIATKKPRMVIKEKLPSVTQLLADTNPSSQILPGLFLGSALDAYKVCVENPWQIQCVLALVNSFFNKRLEEVLGEESVLRLSLEGQEWDDLIQSTSGKKTREELPIAEWFCSAFAFIDQALREDKKILIHCSAGENRSAGLVVAYLISRIGMSYQDAMAYMSQKYPKMQLLDEIKRGLKKYSSQC